MSVLALAKRYLNSQDRQNCHEIEKERKGCELSELSPSEDWRWSAANLPGSQWIAWHRRATELLPKDATVAQIRAAHEQAYQEITQAKSRTP